MDWVQNALGTNIIVMPFFMHCFHQWLEYFQNNLETIWSQIISKCNCGLKAINTCPITENLTWLWHFPTWKTAAFIYSLDVIIISVFNSFTKPTPANERYLQQRNVSSLTIALTPVLETTVSLYTDIIHDTLNKVYEESIVLCREHVLRKDIALCRGGSSDMVLETRSVSSFWGLFAK